MKRKELITYTVIIFLISLTIIITPAILPVLGVEGNTTTFNVTATITSGSPTITYVDAISSSPSEGTTKVINFYFNATHPNGVGSIPATGAAVSINLSGTTLTDSGCAIVGTNGITLNRYQCNITIYYYTLPGEWTINATIVDQAAATVSDTDSLYTNGNVYGIAIKTTAITFGGSPGQLISSNENPQYVNNTGNNAINQINLTAFELQSGSEFIGAGNFTANTTEVGQTLINNTPVTITNSSIAVSGSRNVYLYLNIPAGIANGTYTSVNPWVVTVS